MVKEFSMSKYGSAEALYKAKAEYWEQKYNDAMHLWSIEHSTFVRRVEELVQELESLTSRIKENSK